MIGNAVCNQCNGTWEMQSRVMCNNLRGVKVNVIGGRPLVIHRPDS